MKFNNLYQFSSKFKIKYFTIQLELFEYSDTCISENSQTCNEKIVRFR